MSRFSKDSTALTAMCTYRVKKDGEDAFIELLRKHWPTLRDAGLASDEPPLIYRGEDEGGEPFFVELLKWRDASAPDRAHELPEVMAVWEPMGALCVERAGRPAMEFPHVEPIPIHS
jgi:hypothetical protein